MKKEFMKKLQSLTILYAEDEEGVRRNIADSLGYYVKEVYQASNGQEALDLYEEKKPDIILSDIHMPILDGIEFVKEVRNTNRNIRDTMNRSPLDLRPQLSPLVVDHWSRLVVNVILI